MKFFCFVFILAARDYHLVLVERAQCVRVCVGARVNENRMALVVYWQTINMFDAVGL